MYGAADEVVPLLVKGDIDLAAIPQTWPPISTIRLREGTGGGYQHAGRLVCGYHRG